MIRLIGTPDYTQKLGGDSVNQYQVPGGLWLKITIRGDRVIETGISDGPKTD